MASFLHRFTEKAGEAGGVTPRTNFRDVNRRTPHMANIQWLGGAGVTTGYPNGTYRGNGTVTRQNMAAFLHRLDNKLK